MSERLQAMQDTLDRMKKGGASQLEINAQEKRIALEKEKHKPLTFADLIKKHCA